MLETRGNIYLKKCQKMFLSGNILETAVMCLYSVLLYSECVLKFRGRSRKHVEALNGSKRGPLTGT